MSLMSWLFPKSKRSKAPPSSGPTSGGSRKATHKETAAASSKRKGERTARRELLYTVVREALVRAGVLSASYKFKVLSLDASGRQFLVMIDLAREFGGDPEHLAEVEALIAQSAKSRHDILVTSVYWRLNDHVAVGSPGVRKGTHSQPVPLESQPTPLESVPGRAPAFEPIEADEVEAFQRALVEGSTGPVPLSPIPVKGGKSGPRNYTLLTGYEDTEMPDPDHKSPLLSGTQYGDLR